MGDVGRVRVTRTARAHLAPPGRARAAMVTLSLLLSVLASSLGLPAVAPDASPAARAASAGATRPDSGEGWISSTMARMSLPEKVGQLFISPVYGSAADAHDERNRQAYGVDTPSQVVQRYNLGGVIYFAWTDSFTTPAGTARLGNGLQRAAMRTGARVPLQIGTDQEQGIVTRFGPPATQLPGSMALGAGSLGAKSLGAGSLGAAGSADARRAAEITGGELRAVGVNQDFAPVADVNVNPANPVIGVRSFSGNPQLAGKLVTAQVHGYQDTGRVVATAKHFPGHGDTAVDSHSGLPKIDHSRAEWRRLDAPPFRKAIKAGIDSIMTGHLVMPGLDDSGEPATLSPKILTGLLRDELGFDGVVVTDSLRMEGVRTLHSDAEIPVLALKAGADQLLMPPDLDLAIDSVLQAVRSGRLSEERIDRSVHRILRMKWDRDIITRPMAHPGSAQRSVGSPERLTEASRITDRTITALSNPGGTLPMPSMPDDALVTGWGQSTTGTLAERIGNRGIDASAMPTGAAPDEQEIAGAVRAARDSELTVVLTNGARSDSGQRELLRRVAATGTTVVAVAVTTPYDAGLYGGTIPDMPWLATYSYQPVSMESLAGVVLGEHSPEGRLPVAVPGTGGGDGFNYGAGVSW